MGRRGRRGTGAPDEPQVGPSEDPARRARPTRPPRRDPAVPAAALEGLPADVVALLRVPAFGDDWCARCSRAPATAVLQQGVGHYDGAALPGEVGNFALAGHRTTYGAPFNAIAELVPGDAVVVETPTEFHVYRVTTSQVVRPSDVEVIAPVPGPARRGADARRSSP